MNASQKAVGSASGIPKESIREQMKSKRANMTPEQALAAGRGLIRHFRRLRVGVNWLLYSPLPGEIDTRPLYDYARRLRQDRVYFPRVKGETIEFQRVDAWDDLKPGRYGNEPSGTGEVWDPKSPSVIVVPGVAFSREGHRIGFGKGYYDRFLFQYRHLPRLAVAYDFQLVLDRTWSPELNDQVMDYVITPEGVWGSPRVQN